MTGDQSNVAFTANPCRFSVIETERTLVLIKPDGLARGLTGSILAQFEDAGLRILALRLRMATREIIDAHYPPGDKFATGLGTKTVSAFENNMDSLMSLVGTTDPTAIGHLIRDWLFDYLLSGPVLAFVLQGPAAVRNVRRIVGDTIPAAADPASIRGRFGLDSPLSAVSGKRAIYNVIHAATSVEEAEHEIGLWFPQLAQ